MKKIISTIATLVAMLFYCKAQNGFQQEKPNHSKHDFANESLSNLMAPTSVNVDLLPGANAAKNLGSSAKKWKNIYLSGSLISGGDAKINGVTVGTGSGGFGNTIVGNNALNANTTGNSNTAVGELVLYNNTSDIKPERHSTDTHGTNQVNFFTLLVYKYKFAPRYRDLHKKMEYFDI